jgi:hypothetical protein
MLFSLLSPARASKRSASRARRDARRDETLLFLGRTLGPQLPLGGPLDGTPSRTAARAR